jgi:hypothetical protein
MLTGLHFVYASYFSYCGHQGYNTVYSGKYQCSTMKIKAAVFLQPVSTVLPEHTLSNPEDHNTNIQNERPNSLFLYYYIIECCYWIPYSTVSIVLICIFRNWNSYNCFSTERLRFKRGGKQSSIL